jgi:hypothetical protein
MHGVENVKDQPPSAAVRSANAGFSATSIVMPIIIRQTRIYAQSPHALYPGRHLRHVVNRPGSKTKLIDKLTHRPRHTMPTCAAGGTINGT